MDKTEADLFGLLDSASEEFCVRDARAYAQELNLLLINEGDRVLSDDETGSIITELDKKVERYIGGDVIITGHVQYMNRNTGRIERMFVEDMEASFNGYIFDINYPQGFFTDEDQDYYDFEEPIARTRRIGYNALVRPSLVDSGLEDSGRQRVGVIFDIDSHISFKEISGSRASAVLESIEPQLLSEIDERIMGEDVKSESDALLGLRGLQIETPDDINVRNELFRAIESYLEEVIGIDVWLPYIINFYGKIYTLDEEGEIENEGLLDTKVKSLCSIYKICVVEPMEDESVASIYLDLRIYGQPTGEVSEVYRLKLDDIASLRSLRDDFYEKDPEDR